MSGGGTTGLPAADPARLDALERDVRSRFDVVETPVPVGDHPVSLLRPRSADALISEADFVADERLPYWADVWPSSTVLARHVGAMWGGRRRLLELGCGLGLVSASAAARGFDVLATDYYEDALRFAELNVGRVTGTALRTLHLDWRALPEDLPRFDVVLASDVLYEPAYAELVAEVFARTLGPRGEGWVADPGRVATGLFIDEVARRGIQLERAEKRTFTEGDIRQTITLYRLWFPARRG